VKSHSAVVPQLVRALVARAEHVCVLSYLCAWLAAAAVWVVNWIEDGPAPSGPRYNGAKHFLDNLTPFAHHTAQEWTVSFGTTILQWFDLDLGACFTLTFGILILVLGATQWLLLGKFARFVDSKRGGRYSGALFVVYAVWAAFCLFLWLFA